MMTNNNLGNGHDVYNWCSVSDLTIILRKKNPWEKRKNVAFFRGAATSKHRSIFGFTEGQSQAQIENPDLVENWHPNAEETERIIQNQPSAHIRVFAANLSYYNQDLLDAKISTEEVIAHTIKAKMNLTDWCFDDCGRIEF